MNQVRIFISYAHVDLQQVEPIYQRLVAEGFAPWIDEEELLPGMNWEPEIQKAVRQSDFFLLCLSQRSANRRGFIQKEIKIALNVWEERLHDDIYFIPVLLEDCDVPEHLQKFQWARLDERGWNKLLKALRFGATKLGKQAAPSPEVLSRQNVLSSFEFVTATVNERGKIIEQQTGRAHQFTEDLVDGIKLELVHVPGGEFLMGAPPSEKESRDCERPQHRVKVSPFYIGKYPITQEQWQVIAEASQLKAKITLDPMPSNFKGKRLPVEYVTWYEALEFCARLEKLTGRQYRLPSEAEWEYACRAGTQTPFAFGSTITPELVNYDGNKPYASATEGEYRGKTTPVGGLGVANAFGLFDLHGNVWEWCEDRWHEHYDGAPEDGSVWLGAGNSSPRVLRGGSWFIIGSYCRSAFRFPNAPGNRNKYMGFRVVVSARIS